MSRGLLWSAAAVLRFNSAYSVAEFLPELCLIGTDAAALGYGFDRRKPEAVVSVERVKDSLQAALPLPAS